MHMLYDSESFVVVHMLANQAAEGEQEPDVARHGFEIVDKRVNKELVNGPCWTSSSSSSPSSYGYSFGQSSNSDGYNNWKNKNVETLPDMVGLLRELGVRLVACEMSMGVMGVTREELLPDIDYGGVATYLGDASRSKITLFI